MHLFANFAAQRDAHIRRPVITIGTFDGVHLGHRQVLDSLVALAKKEKGRPGVLTFRVHPRKVLTGQGPLWLTSIPYRLRLFQQAGVKFTTFIPFTKELSLLSPREFVAQILVEQLQVKGVVMGYDSCFGHKGSGTPQMMENFGREFGFAVSKVARVECNTQTAKLSSSAIREFISAGELGRAEQLLARPFALLGRVAQGQQRGRTIGIPTANLDAAHTAEVLLPPHGVYATYVFVGPPAQKALSAQKASPAQKTLRARATSPDLLADEQAALGRFTGPYPAVTNIGVRPTVDANATQAVVESHLIDFSRDLYGRTIAVVFAKRLRGEQKFPGLDALRAQIATDITQARTLFAHTKPPARI